MDCDDRPITDVMLTNLRGCCADAMALLGLPATATPADRVAAADAFVHRWQRGDRPPGVDPADVPYLIGSLWGEAVVDALGWSWRLVTFRRHADVPAAAVVSPDRSLAIFPIHVVLAAADDAHADVTIRLSFDHLSDGRLDGFTPGGFANVTDVVHRDA